MKFHSIDKKGSEMLNLYALGIILSTRNDDFQARIQGVSI